MQLRADALEGHLAPVEQRVLGFKGLTPGSCEVVAVLARVGGKEADRQRATVEVQ